MITFATSTGSNCTAGAHTAVPHPRHRAVLAHGSWRRVTRRILCSLACALTASSLLMPSVSLAAEWVTVDGVRHEAAAGPTGDAAGTWSWDGADDMKLNGYDGGPINAAGKLNVSYEGENTVTGGSESAIKVSDGYVEKAELNITGSESSTLNAENSSYMGAIDSAGTVTIDGTGTVNAEGGCGITANGDVTVKGGGEVAITASGDGIITSGDISITDSKLSSDGGEHGISGRNVSIDNSTVKASADMHDATALMAYGGDVSIRNGSNVSLLAEGVYAYGIHTTNFDENGPGGSVFIESSNVEAIARYIAELPPIDGGDIILRGGPDDSGRTSGHVYGILAHTNKGLSPAVINIVKSNVSAAGDDGAIFAAAVTLDGSQTGTIVIASGDIVKPAGGVVRDIHIASKPDNPTVTKGQLIASPGDLLDDVTSGEIAKHAVITPNDDPGDMGSGGEDSKHDAVFKKDDAKAKPAAAKTASAKANRTSDILAATGDESAAAIIAAAIAGTAAIGAGVITSRKRS